MGKNVSEITDEERDAYKAECWKAFWEEIARLWLLLPREVQLEYSLKYPRKKVDDAAE